MYVPVEVLTIVDHIVSRVIELSEIEIRYISYLFTTKRGHQIELEPSIKLAHYYCIKNSIPPQVSGCLIERYIVNKFNMHHISSSLVSGDACFNGTNYEIKASFGGVNRNRFNYVQLRVNHSCSYILTAYYLCPSNVHTFGELYMFCIDKKNMIDLIHKYGSYAHGSKLSLGPITLDSLVESGNKKEYALRITYGSTSWFDLLRFYVHPTRIELNQFFFSDRVLTRGV